MTDASGTTSYTFDDLSRLTGVVSPTDTFGCTFDVLGNLAATTHTGLTTQLKTSLRQTSVVMSFAIRQSSPAEFRTSAIRGLRS